MRVTLPNYFKAFLLLLAAIGLPPTLAAQGDDCTISSGRLSTDAGGRVVSVCLDNPQGTINVNREGFEGDNSQYFITTSGGVILEVPQNDPPFDLSAYGERTLAIWSVAFSGTLVDIAPGDNICASSATECFSLSNAIAVARRTGADCAEDECDAMAGNVALANGEVSTTVCIDDGSASAIAVTQTGTISGDNSTFLITNTAGEILNIPAGNGPFDLSGAGAGTCNIWYLAYDDGLTGLAVGNTPDDFNGCFSLSNPVVVNRLSGDDCPEPPCEVGPTAITLVGGGTETVTCAGDGEDDFVDVVAVTTSGTDFAWAITNSQGRFLSLPDAPPFNFEEEGAGVCIIWGISFTGTITGLEVGADVSDLDGCLTISNSIFVVRRTGDECEDDGGEECTVDGGTLTIADRDGDSFTICAGDGVADPFSVLSAGFMGPNFTYVVTSADGEILNLTDTPDFDFEEAGGGACQVWGLAFEDDLAGAEVGANVSGLEGCFDLSNPITVTRNTGDDCDDDGGEECNVVGGMLVFDTGDEDLTICADATDDGQVTVALTGNSGGNQAFVITDENLEIIGLPTGNPLDFSGADPGVCLIWSVSFEDDFTGATIGANAADLGGCFELSNSIRLDRIVGDECGDEGECEAEGGVLSLANMEGDSFTICAGDGVADPFSVLIAGFSATNFTYLVTSEDGEILMVTTVSDFDFEAAGGGACQVWGLAFEDDLTGAEVGANVSGLEGCFDLSNPITVTRNTGDECEGDGGGGGEEECEADGGTLALANMEGDGFTICAGDGVADPFSVLITGFVGTNFTYVVTSEDGEILMLTTVSDFDFEEAGGGACQVWGLAFEDGLTGAEVGANVSGLEGCFDLSNPITVTRNTGDECEGDGGGGDGGGGDDCTADGGTLSIADRDGDSFTICAGDGNADPFSVLIADFVGTNFTYVVTSADGEILNITDIADFDFEGAGGGACQVWGLAFEPGLTGAEVGANVSGLEGCFDLSNPVTVTRNTGDECEGDGGGGGGGGVCEDVDGGTLTILEMEDVTTFTICAGDGIEDPFSVLANGFSGGNFTYVVTSASGEILNLTNVSDFDFEGAGGGACQVWGLAFEDGLTGAVVGANVSGLEGCFDLSNPITVNRNTGDECGGGGIGGGGDDCNVQGGILTFDTGDRDLTICVDGSEDDQVAVTLTNESGPNQAWVITTEDLEILRLPTSQPFDFSDVDPGICLIWSLSFEDDLAGAVVGANADDLTGCFELSNSIVIDRIVGEGCETDGEEPCEAAGGILTLADLTGNALTICAGDGEADPFDVILTDNVGENLAWIITDTDQNILGLPAAPPFDLEGAGGGTCQVWALSFDGTVTGLAVDENVGDFQGCFELSNPITVTRNTGDQCNPGLAAGDIVINEVFNDGQVEFLNRFASPVDLASLYVSNGTSTINLRTAGVTCGEFLTKSGDITVIDLSQYVESVGGELSLYATSSLSDDDLLSYVAWGTGTDRPGAELGIALGIWSADNTLAAITPDASVQLVNTSAMALYALGVPSLCTANEFSVSTSNPTAGESLAAYPNPFGSTMTVEIEGLKADRTNLQVLDITGRVMLNRVLDFRDGRMELSTGKLPAGTYVLRLSNERGISTTRVVKR